MKKIYTILTLLILASVAIPAPAVAVAAFGGEEWRGPAVCGDPIGGCFLDPLLVQTSNP